jgi:UrcA family protein
MKDREPFRNLTDGEPRTDGAPSSSGHNNKTEKELHMTSPKNAIALASLIASGIAFLPVAFAEAPPARSIAERVAYYDLDLGTESGARTLLHRIENAASRACTTGVENSPAYPRARAEHRDCVSDAVASAVRSVDAPVLTAMIEPKSQPSIGVLAAR